MQIRQRIFRNEFGRRGRLVLRNRPAVYHVMSRAVLKAHLFSEEEKAVFCRMLKKQAAFAGVEILTYCIMDNHFHLLLRVPPSPLTAEGVRFQVSNDELLKRYEAYYGDPVPVSTYSVEELKAILAAGGAEAEEARERVLARMGDLSAFMRELKQRFVIWYNAQRENTGTIWSARFKSVLVEDSAEIVSKVAAYIDLNPIRAGLVKDPAEYRWSAYAAAMAGVEAAREGIAGIFGDTLKSYRECIRSYRLILFGKGAAAKDGKGVARISAERLEALLKDGGEISLDEALRCRVRYFSDSGAIGNQAFVEHLFEELRHLFGRKRKTAGAEMKGGCWGAAYSLRDLKKAIFS